MSPFRSRLTSGYTIVELIIVITILSIAAAIAIPGFSSSSDRQLQLAAEEFASAIRFARSEAIRLGEPHGFLEEPNDKRMRIFRLDTATNPATLIYDVRNPVDKSIYDLQLDNHAFAAVDLVTPSIVYRGTCDQPDTVYFDRRGTPWCANPTTVSLGSHQLHMSLGSSHRVITLDGVTGRVTVR